MNTHPDATVAQQTFVARLHHDKIETYELIHEAMTLQHAEALRRRFFRLDIYRLGDVLVMIKHPRPGPATQECAAIEDELERWRVAVGECFAEFWRPSDMIFELSAAGR